MNTLTEEGRHAPSPSHPGDYVDLWTAGSAAEGTFFCVTCGLPVFVHRRLPPCPMCSQRLWEREETSPYARDRDSQAATMETALDLLTTFLLPAPASSRPQTATATNGTETEYTQAHDEAA